MPAPTPARPAVALVGAGAMARVLGLRLVQAGYPVRAVISRTKARARALADVLSAPLASDRLAELPAAPLVILAVPDDQIAGVAQTLSRIRRSWAGTVVLHTSGAALASALEPLRSQGARTLSFHPVQSLPAGTGASRLDGVKVGIEGEPSGVAAGVELADELGLRHLVVPAGAKPRYHLAATMASNLMVALMGMAQEVLASIGVDRAQAVALLEPLVRGTLDALAETSPETALTGPVARGDLGTLEAHGRALHADLPHLAPAYAALSVEAVRLAIRAGTLPPDRAGDVLALMERMVAPSSPPRPASAAPEVEPARTEPAEAERQPDGRSHSPARGPAAE